ncbi:MAG: MBL fold metallo-hydrolase [Hespellia sp.]|nr:MBL fold metallo-hydrolase [Hespellia sp.]
MKINRFVVGMAGTNCYVVENEKTKECVIVDPGDGPQRALAYLKEAELVPVAVLLTHGHFDHIMGLDSVLADYQIPVYAFEKEAELLRDERLNASVGFGTRYAFDGAEFLSDNQKLELAGYTFQVIYTPGHTIGGCCFYVESEGVLFSGDTLFQASVGRSDLPTGSAGQLIRSIEERLMVLPEDTKVYPGHMEETSIAYEKAYNPFL